MPVTRCAICKRLLTDPYSVAVGIGPECRGKVKKSGQALPKPRWKVVRGRIVFDGLEIVNDLDAKQKEQRK